MWRILSRAEASQFRYDGDPYGIRAERVGYIVKLMVRMHGHDHCACHGSMHPEEVHLFHVHPPTLQFPMHITVTDDLLRNLHENGCGVQLPGVIVHMPNHISHISYGWLQC